MKYCFGADVGGTTIKLGLFTVDGEILDKWEIITRTENEGESILQDIATALKEKIQEKAIPAEEVIGIGMGIPAPVNSEGIVRKTANLGWGYKEVKKELENLTGWQVVVGGEIGHICVNYFEEKCCGCGKKGCLEQYASATGIARIAREHLAADTKDSILQTYDLDKIDAKIVFDALKEGDQLAVDVVEEFGEYLAKGLADVAVVVDPSLFVIGGGVSKAGEILLTYIEKYYRKRAFFANKDTQFAIASLGNDAGICGAAKLILDSQV